MKQAPPLKIRAFVVAALVVLTTGLVYVDHNVIFFYNRQRIIDRAQVLFEEDKFEEVLPFYYRILKHNPDDGEVLAGRASVYLIMGNLDAAETDAQRAIDNGETVKGLLARGQVKFLRGDPDAGLIDLDEAIRLCETEPRLDVNKPTKALLLGSKGTMLLVKEHFEEARLFYVKALELHDEGIHRYNYGMWFMYQRMDEDAVREFTKSIESRPMVMTYMYRGYTYLRLGRPSEALQDAEKALDSYESDFTWYLRGLARFFLKKYDGSIADIEEAIRLRTSDQAQVADLEQMWGSPYEHNLARALTQRAISYMDSGLYNKAALDMNRASELYPEFVPIWLAKAHAHLRLGDNNSGLQSLRKAVELDSSYQEEIGPLITDIEADLSKIDDAPEELSIEY